MSLNGVNTPDPARDSGANESSYGNPSLKAPGKPRLKDMIEGSEEYLRKQHDRWDSSVRLYKGEVTILRRRVTPRWNHIVEVNLTRPTIDVMLPNLIFQTPKVMFRPAREIADQQMQQQALTIENDLNAVQLSLHLGTEFQRATKDALMLGDGFVKFGLTDTFDYDPEDFPFPAPFAKRASPWDVGIDPYCREADLSDAEYVWFRSLVPLYKARRDKKLKNPERLKACSISEFVPKHLRDAATSNLAKRTAPYEFTVLYELWSKPDKKMYVVDRDALVYRADPFPYDLMGEFPLVHLAFNDVPDEFYCKSEAEFLETLQLEASEKRTQWLNHTRRFNRKYWCPPDMSEDDKGKMAEGNDGTMVTSREPPQPIADAPMPGDISQEIAMIYSEAKEVSGISAYQKGGSEKSIRSATEAHMIDASSNIRIEARRNVIANAIAKGSEILYNILRPSRGWPIIPFQFTVDISTMKRPDDNEKRQDLMQFGQVAAPFPEFNKAAWLSDVSLAFGKPPDQYMFSQQQMQQMQQNAPPNPEMIKAQIMQQQQQADMAKMQMQMQIEQQKAQIELKKMQAEIQLEVQMMQEKLGFQRDTQQLEMQGAQQKMAMESQAAQQKLAVQQQSAQMDMIAKAHQAEQKNKHAEEAGKVKVATMKAQAAAKPVSKPVSSKPKGAKK